MPGATILPISEIQRSQVDVLAVALSPTTSTTAGCAPSTARPPTTAKSLLDYDEAADTFTNAEGKVYKADSQELYVAEDGSSLNYGWRVFVGADNFTRTVHRQPPCRARSCRSWPGRSRSPSCRC